MFKHLIFIVILFSSYSVLAQYDGKGENEASRFRPGVMAFFTGLRPAKPGKPNKYDRLIFDLTYNDWIGDIDIFTNHWASIGLNTNFIFDIPLSAGNTVSLGLGVSHQYVYIRHNNHLIKSLNNPGIGWGLGTCGTRRLAHGELSYFAAW